jgi:tRNA (guanine37-N1)-methyltransferase
MQFSIVTLFPDVCTPYLASGIVGRAQGQGIISTTLINIRDFSADAYKSVDNTPYGGGAGMVMSIEPIDKALASINQEIPRDQQHVIVLSARGKQFTQTKALELAALSKHITLICGRYEGIDQRVADNLADEELSIGPYVLSGGELGALAILDSITRLLPGALGNPASLEEESTETTAEYPHYTKPEDYKGWKVPPVLLSGNHAAIKKWREDNSQ